jgi:peptidoglycan/xylan/chitin deacetylase (PgdA/CDA1 family)
MNVILAYHRIADDGWRYSVRPAHFREHLDVLDDISDVMSLADLVRERAAPHARHRVAITFDDGYQDNVVVAWPELRRRAIPATFFIVSGWIGKQREYWWDELEWLLAHPDRRNQSIQLAIDDSLRQWERAFDAQRDLLDVLTKHDPDAQRRILDALAVALRVRQPHARPERLPMTLEQLTHLASEELAEIGAHTVEHVHLPSCTSTVQAAEIRSSKRALEHAIDRVVTSFAYPFGEYSEETVRLVEQAGFLRACGTSCMPVGNANVFTVPRCYPQDENGESFSRRFHEFMNHPW